MSFADTGQRVACVCLTGPTATGKTELALKLAEEIPLEIVSMDSALVYRGMDIGTAKPSALLRGQVPHHLIDVVDAADTYSAGRFVRDANAAIDAISERNRLPLLVGGTHLYLRALRDGLADLPEADKGIRERLDAEALEKGWPLLHARLAVVDPDAAKRIAPADGQRIQRALEVFEMTGEPLSVRQRSAQPARARRIKTFALVPGDRAILGLRIEQRFDAMVRDGFVNEVAGFRARPDLDAKTPAMRAVGYRQIWAHLAGETVWRDARVQALAATRQLAKRQLTSLRSDRFAETVPADSANVAARLLDRVSEELNA